MKALSIARKTLIEYVREPLLLGLLFAFPILVLVFYFIAFGETDQGLAKYLTVWVLNEDDGAEKTAGGNWQAGAQLIDVMRALEWEGAPVFDVSLVTDRRAAEISLWERKTSLLLILPPDFSKALLDAAVSAHGTDGGSPATISLVGDPNSYNFVFARSFVEELVRWFTQYAVDWASGEFSLGGAAWTEWDAGQTVVYEFLPGTGTMSDFDFGVPGVIVFGVMFVMISTAMTMVRENVDGTLQRLRLSPIHARDLLLGVTLAQMLIALAMVPVTFAAAIAMGFRAHGSLPLVMGIGMLLSLPVVGLGLIVACFARNDGEAANLSATVGVLTVLLSGAMYPMPDVPLVTIGDHTVQIYDLVPFTHAAEAMRQVLVKGEGVGAIEYELVMLIVLAAVFLAAGVVLYERLQLRKT
jgi:ABC-2 type transport system permease protein